MGKIYATLLASLTLFATGHFTHAGSGTWDLRPINADWQTPANWTPDTVPDGPNEIATVASSNQTAVSLSAPAEVNALTFQPGAGDFTITTALANIFTLIGAGIVNGSGKTQHFIADQDESGSLGAFTLPIARPPAPTRNSP